MGLAHPKHWRELSSKFHSLVKQKEKITRCSVWGKKKKKNMGKAAYFSPKLSLQCKKHSARWLFVTLSAVATPHGKFPSQ